MRREDDPGREVDPDPGLDARGEVSVSTQTPDSQVEPVVQVLDAQLYQGGVYAIAVIRFMDTEECWLYAFGPEAGLFTEAPSPVQVLETARAYYEFGIGPVGEQSMAQWLRALLSQPTETGTVGVAVRGCAIPAYAPSLFGQENEIPGGTGDETGGETTEPPPNDAETGGTDTKTLITWAAAAAAGLFLLNKGL